MAQGWAATWNGWPLLGWASLAIAAMIGVVFAVTGSGEEGLRSVVRATARSSVSFFLLAFAASSLRRLWPSPVTAWLLRNRRQLGVSFGASHAAHLAAIIALAVQVPGFTGTVSVATLVFGGFGYLVLAAMTATSFDRSAAWLGRPAWRRLHLWGGWYLWIVWTVQYAGKTAESVAFLPLVLVLLAVGGLRIALGLSSRSSLRATAS